MKRNEWDTNGFSYIVRECGVPHGCDLSDWCSERERVRSGQGRRGRARRQSGRCHRHQLHRHRWRLHREVRGHPPKFRDAAATASVVYNELCLDHVNLLKYLCFYH